MNLSNHSMLDLIPPGIEAAFIQKPTQQTFKFPPHRPSLERTTPFSSELLGMRYLALSIAAALCAVPMPAEARIFSSSGWYSVVVNEHNDIDQVIAGPSAEKVDCEKDQLERIVGDERTILYLSGAPHHVYLSNRCVTV